jgi:hypothetical protein
VHRSTMSLAQFELLRLVLEHMEPKSPKLLWVDNINDNDNVNGGRPIIISIQPPPSSSSSSLKGKLSPSSHPPSKYDIDPSSSSSSSELYHRRVFCFGKGTIGSGYENLVGSKSAATSFASMVDKYMSSVGSSSSSSSGSTTTSNHTSYESEHMHKETRTCPEPSVIYLRRGSGSSSPRNVMQQCLYIHIYMSPHLYT